MSAPAAPPAWVLALDIPSGAWRCLVGLWSFARYGATGDERVWPSRETLAERTGQKPATVKKQLRRLVELGLVERGHGSEIVLVWRADSGEAATTVTQGVTTVTGDHSHPGGNHSHPPVDHSHPQGVTTVTPNVVGNLQLPCREVAEPAPEHVRAKLAVIEGGSAAHPEPELADPTPSRERMHAENLQAALIADMAPTWRSSMREVAVSYGLTTDELVGILRAWDSAPRSSRPPLHELWWSRKRSRKWLDRHLRQGSMLGAVQLGDSDAKAIEFKAGTPGEGMAL